MGQPRKDAKAQAMYDLYLAGRSLAEVGAAFEVSRQTVYAMFKRRGWAMRARPEPLPFVEFNGRRYTMRTIGYYGATTGARSFLHRDVWEHHHGLIPPGYDIHHRDGDKTNNALENLELLTKADHARLHG